MHDATRFYVDGRWVDPVEPRTAEVINPATEEPCGRISLGSAADVDAAVAAARRAFPAFAATTPAERADMLRAILDGFQARYEDVATAVMEEMGAPWSLAHGAQAGSGTQHLKATIKVLESYQFETRNRSTLIVREPIGVCGLITPWNWPVNQVAVKVAPALAAGCTVVLKPSEIAPFDSMILAEIIHQAGLPAGVFNLVNGDGQGVGSALSAHPGVDMISFTGSTRAGVAVALNAAPTVKRVAQELGGKSANILLDDVDFARAVKAGVLGCMHNSGQSCNAPTRLLVPAQRMSEVAEIAKQTAERIKVGDPREDGVFMGPVVSQTQWTKIQKLIQTGIDEGAQLVTGGTLRPPTLQKGYYVKPTVFASVSAEMTIAREEIFGPVLSIMGYESEQQAIDIANDTPYGLSGYVSSASLDRAREVARQLRTGMVHLNGADLDSFAPFGGYKQSGNGREWGAWGMEEFLELKSIYGAAA